MSEATEYGSAVTFRCGGELFAFRIGEVIEINTRTDYTFVPKLPKYIVGVLNLMGDVIPVVDFRRRLGFPDIEYGIRSCQIVVRHEEYVAAVRVDGVNTSIELTQDNYLSLPDSDSIISGYITDSDGGRISLINTERFFDIK